MTTAWSPVTQLERRQWLLANGEVLTEPDLEQTPSGRKLRVKGTTLTAWAKDLDDLLSRAAIQVAQERGTKVWMPLNRGLEASRTGFRRKDYLQAKVNLVGDASEETVLWWRFKHAELPIEATLALTIDGRTRWQVEQNYAISVHAKMIWQSTVLEHISTYVGFMVESRAQFVDGLGRAGLSYDDMMRWQAFIRDNPPIWDTQAISVNHLQNTRLAAKQMLKVLREFDSINEIDIPDLRDPASPAWLRLELFDTNVHAGVEQDILDVLDGEATVTEAREQYEEFQNSLRKIGLVLGDLKDNDLIAALNGDKAPVMVDVNSPLDEGGNVDSRHQLMLHLPTGTMYVRCLHQKQDMNEVAEKWEEAQLIASLSGQEDELLAYAREYVARKNESVMKDLVASRDVAD